MIDRLINSAGREEWRRHWPVVVGAMIGLIVAHIHLYSLGVMITPLEGEFGWPRTQITSGLMVVSFVIFTLAPLLGAAVDRFGPRRIVLCGVSIYAAAISGLSLAQAAEWTWWALWGLVAFGALCLNPTVWVAAISRGFDASRGLALSIVLSATGIISFAAPMVTYKLVAEFGWRHAYQFWGAGVIVIALPLIWLCFQLDRGKGGHDRSVSPRPEVQPGYTLSQCVRTTAFRKLLIAGPVMAVVFTAIMLNAVPILIEGGVGVGTAAVVAGVLGLAQGTGRLLTGYFIDRFDPRRIGGMVVLLPALACVLLAVSAASIPIALLAMFLFGLGAGAELDVLGYLASHHFGMRSFGAAFGIIIGLAALGTGVGPMLASLAYDHTGSYLPVLVGAIPLCLMSSWAFSSLGAYPDFAVAEVDTTPS